MIQRHKTSIIAAALLAAIALGGQPSAASQPSDAWLTTKTKIALLTAKDVSSFAVNVDSVDGVVSLHGTVTSDNDKAGAERVARGIEGVKDVQNFLAVKPEEKRDVKKMRKEELQLIADVNEALKKDATLAGNDIKVKSAAGGVVLLTGTAKSPAAELQAIQIARDVDGVDGAMSEVTTPPGADVIVPKEPPASLKTAPVGDQRARDVAADAWITAKTKMELLADSKTPGTSINVDTVRGVVTLFGKVPTAEASAKAEKIAHGVEGVVKVNNALQIEASKEAKGATNR